jgi:hypothetical protein
MHLFTFLFAPIRGASVKHVVLPYTFIIFSTLGSHKANAQNIAAGANLSIGLKSNGSIVCWGDNNYGQSSVPDPNSAFVTIAAKSFNSIGLKSDGSVVCWGDNGYGQCTVPGNNSEFVAITAGVSHSVGLKSNGTVVCWGDNSSGQSTVINNSGFVAIAAGSYHSLGLKSDGSVVCWGYNRYGQCTVPGNNSGFVAIAAGAYFSIGLKSDGTVVCWGDNSYGQSTIHNNSGFVAIAAGAFHSIGLKSDRTVVCWGEKRKGQCTVPPNNSEFVSIAGGSFHSMGLKADGSVVYWGDNGQYSVPSPNSGFSLKPNSAVALAASEITANSFLARWVPSVNAEGYYIDVSTNASFTSGNILNNYYINGGNVSSYSITRLDDNTTYYYRVRAANNHGISYHSVYIPVTTLKYDQKIVFDAIPAKTYGDGSFTVSATGGSSGNPVTFTSSDNTIASCTGTNGSTITILKAGTCNIYANQAGNNSYNSAPQVSQTLTVQKKPITIEQIIPNSKVYNGNTSFSITDLITTGYNQNDDVILNNGTLSFADKNVGNSKPLTASGFSLSGVDAGNYTLTQPTNLTADITPASLTPALTASSKVYNGTTDAEVSATISGGLINNDIVVINATNGRFDRKQVGNAKTVTADITVNGADAGNYTIVATATTTANITPATLTPALTTINKVYDGNTDAVVSATIAGGLVNGDVVAINATNGRFDSKQTGNAKTVTADITVSGTDAGNYTIAATATTTVDISPASLIVEISAANKPYDGTNAATVTATITSGLIAGDVVTPVASNARFASINVGTGISVTADITLGGIDAGNYTSNTTAMAIADILDDTPPMVTFGGLSGNFKPYNAITITFSEPVNLAAASLNDALIIREGGANGNAVTYSTNGYTSGNLSQFTLTAALKCGTTYYIAVTAGTFADASGNNVILTKGTFATANNPDMPVLAGGASSLCAGSVLSISNFDNSLQYQWLKDNSTLAGETGSQYVVPANDAGSYTVNAENTTTGCSSASAALPIQVYPQNIPVVHEKKDNAVTLLIVDNSSNAFSDYQWYYADGSSLPATLIADRQFLTLANSDRNNQYLVQTTDKNGCTTQSNTVITKATETSVRVYPTVSNGSFKVDMVHPNNGEIIIKVINQRGTSVKQYSYTKSQQSETLEFNIGSVTNGNYMVEVTMGTYKEVKWIVVQ